MCPVFVLYVVVHVCGGVCPVCVLYVGVHMCVRVIVPYMYVVCRCAHVCEHECALAACVEVRGWNRVSSSIIYHFRF